MTYGIWLLALYDRTIAEWLLSYDPDASDQGTFPTGLVSSTPNAGKAMSFDSMIEATDCIMQQSVVQPLRPDGRPNRPLRAFTLEVRRLPDA